MWSVSWSTFPVDLAIECESTILHIEDAEEAYQCRGVILVNDAEGFEIIWLPRALCHSLMHRHVNHL